MKKKLISFIISSFILLSTSNAFSGNFSVGKKVLAPYGGNLVEAQIIAGPNKRGEFRVHYDKTDSSRDKWVQPKLLKDPDDFQNTNSSTNTNSTATENKTATPSTGFAVGKKVLAPYGGDMVEAEIISGPNRNGEFRVHYDKTDYSRDKWLEPKYLKDAEEAQKTNNSLKFKAGDMVDVSRDGKMWYEGKIEELKYGKYIVAVTGYQGTSEYSETEIRAKAEVNMTGTPSVGDKVEYLSSTGRFIKGIVKEIKDGKYTVQTGNYDTASVEARSLNSVAKQQEIALQKIQDDYYKTFWTDVSKYTESVKYVAEAYNADMSGGYTHIEFTPEKIKKVSSDLVELDALCKAKYPNLENPTYLTNSQKNDIAYVGGDWRKIAEQRKDVIQKAVLIFVKEKTTELLKNKTGNNDEYYVALKDGFNTIKKDITKSLKELKIEETMKSVGLSFNPDWSEYKKDYDKKLAKFLEDLKTRPAVLADNLGNKYSAKDGALEAVARKHTASVITNASVIESGVKSSSWEIEKNDFGIPKYMRRYVGVMVSSKDYRSCIVVSCGVYKDYKGGGTYGAPYAETITIQYIKCK